MANFEEYRFRQLLRSHFLQPPDERKARMSTLIELAAELHRIKKMDIFATKLGEGAVEAVIEGDWERAEGYVSDLRFKDEDEGLRLRYAPLWEPFVITLQAACAEARRRGAGKPSPEN